MGRRAAAKRSIEIRTFSPGGAAFDRLVTKSVEEGYQMLARLQHGWESGANRFDKAGETLSAASVDGRLAGICGRNIDPYAADPAIGRVRHLYVDPDHRRKGVGTALVRAIIEGAARHFATLDLRAPSTAFGFYEALGFQRHESEHSTHRLVLGRTASGSGQ